jgi:WD40 repeat protein
VAAGTGRGDVRLFDATDGRELAVLHGHRHMIQALMFSPDGSTLATGSMDRTVRIWDIARALAGKPAVLDDSMTAPAPANR